MSQGSSSSHPLGMFISPALPHNRHIARLPTTRIDTDGDHSTDARLSRIVRLLSDNATVVISGTRIAEELGTSRSEIWRAVQHLRDLGVRIAGHLATGYQLEAVPDLLLPDVLAPLVKGTIFASHIHHYFRIGSTNVTAMQAAAENEPEGSVFVAEQQTAGRGRGGHTWDSEQSVGIYCSVVLRPRISPVDALFLSLMTGIATAKAVEEIPPPPRCWCSFIPICAGRMMCCSTGRSFAAFSPR